jgi:hypothetical protein
MPDKLRDADLKALGDTAEIQIETWTGEERHRTTSWPESCAR